ncbi:hypothetical protein [Desulfolithobacter dissulfuricans]|nr:hypothetical protein [Desulfolithobacter dissulfuricans]
MLSLNRLKSSPFSLPPGLTALLFFTVFWPAMCLSSNPSEHQQFMDLLLSLNEQFDRQFATEQPMTTVDEIFTAPCLGNEEKHTFGADILREQAVQIRRRTGLELRGYYATGDLANEGSDQGGFDDSSANLELSWDVLKNGYLQYGKKADALEYRAQIAEIQQDMRQNEREGRCRSYNINQSFSEALTILLMMKLQLLEKVYPIERRAYFSNWSFLDDYFVSEENLVLTRQELTYLNQDYTPKKATTNLYSPPLLDVDLSGMIKAILSDNRPEMLTNLEKERLKAEDDADIPDSLSLFVRRNFDINNSTTSGDDLVTGLRFRIPLYDRQTDELRLRLLQAERNKSLLLWKRIAKTRAAHASLREQLRRTVRAHYRQAQARERFRRTLLELQMGADTLMPVAITRMLTLLDAKIELLRAKEELYRRVNEMFLASALPYRSDLVQKVSLTPGLNRARLGDRSIYIWSAGFSAISNENLINFLKAKQIDRVLLSASTKSSFGKITDFLTMAEKNNIRVEMLTGQPDWIFPENQETALARAVTLAERTGIVHLDVEPHTLPGFRQKKKEYLEWYIEFLEKIKQGLLDRRLSVDVPLHFPAETYHLLDSIADRVYVMAYGTTDPDVLTRRLQTVLDNIASSKLVIVLRASDFRDEWALEKMIDKLVLSTGITQYGIHQFRTFFQKTTVDHETPHPEKLFQ